MLIPSQHKRIQFRNLFGSNPGILTFYIKVMLVFKNRFRLGISFEELKSKSYF